MGYRSDVAISLSKAAEVKLRISGLDKAISLLDEANYKSVKEEYTIYIWRSIKWYYSYPEIGMMKRFLDTLDEDEESDFGYGFVRIGEEMADIEVEGNYYDYGLEVEREILTI